MSSLAVDRVGCTYPASEKCSPKNFLATLTDWGDGYVGRKIVQTIQDCDHRGLSTIKPGDARPMHE